MHLIEEPYGPIKIYQDSNNSAQFTGVVCLKSDLGTTNPTTDSTEIMEMFIAGDTAVNLFTLLHSEAEDSAEKSIGRTLHDVMANILAAVQSEVPGNWGLLRVAIVGLENDVFVGRMFFGDKTTGKTHFDCIVRPSDGIFLALQSSAPIFVNRNIWRATYKILSNSTVHQITSKNKEALPEGGKISPPPQRSEKGRSMLLPTDMTELLDDDLDAIKLLKRKLTVAVKEEDYTTAASIRDHPYLLVYREICKSKIHGDSQRAVTLESELARQIENNALRSEPKHDGFKGKLAVFSKDYFS